MENGPTKQGTHDPSQTFLGRDTLADLFYLLRLEVHPDFCMSWSSWPLPPTFNLKGPRTSPFMTARCLGNRHRVSGCSPHPPGIALVMMSVHCHEQEKHGTSFEDFFELLQEAAEEQGLTEAEAEGSKDWVPLQCVEDFISNFNDGAQHFMAATFPDHYLKGAPEPVSDTPAGFVRVSMQKAKAYMSP